MTVAWHGLVKSTPTRSSGQRRAGRKNPCSPGAGRPRRAHSAQLPTGSASQEALWQPGDPGVQALQAGAGILKIGVFHFPLIKPRRGIAGCRGRWFPIGSRQFTFGQQCPRGLLSPPRRRTHCIGFAPSLPQGGGGCLALCVSLMITNVKQVLIRPLAISVSLKTCLFPRRTVFWWWWFFAASHKIWKFVFLFVSRYFWIFCLIFSDPYAM